MKDALAALILPPEVSDFERKYLARLNRIAMWFFALHIPVFTALAYFNDTGPILALALTSLACTVPLLAMRQFDNPRHVALTHGFTSMIVGGLLVHFGQGPVQIEMHFYFFASLAMLAVFGNPLVILIAAGTVAAHHGLLWWYLPASVFNYDAPFWVVAVHAGFVVLESVATCFIARSFFDNVIGLERIVQERTQALNLRNQEMRLVMDHVDQGLITVDRDGIVSQERSAIFDDFLGAPQPGITFEQLLQEASPKAAAHFALSFDQVVDGLLPLEVTLDQLPTRFETTGRYFELAYTPITKGGEFDKLLVVITDKTSEIERQRYEEESREIMGIFERVMKDKGGFLEFFEEASEQVENLVDDSLSDLAVLKRVLHTLKGNSMLFGINTVAQLCHSMEDRIAEESTRPSEEARHELSIRWEHLRKNLETLLGERKDRKIEIDDREYEETLRQILSNGVKREEIAQRVANWKLEHTSIRLERVAEQAKGIARRLNKSDLQVEVEGSDLLLEPEHWASFWSSFTHVIRNAIDHGIEPASEREQQGKERSGRLQLETRKEGAEFVISINDNGRGIDWQRVAERARSMGLPANQQSDLEAALFAEGVSTKDEVTEYSGRGVGMAAVRKECENRSGQIRIKSDLGKGTTVEFRFPDQQMARNPIGGFRVA